MNDKDLNFYSSLGDRIKTIRLSLGLNLQQFGDEFNPVADKSIVSRWERGRSTPNAERIKKIAELGGISVEELLHGNVENFAYNVLIEDINNKGSFYQNFVEKYSRYDNTSPKEISTSFVLDYFETNKELILKKTFDRILTADFNKHINSKGMSIKSSFSNYDASKIISMANAVITRLFRKEDTFEVYYHKLSDAVKYLPISKTNLSLGELEKRYEKSGYNKEDAHRLAKDKFYINIASNKLSDFNSDIDALYDDYLNDN